MVVTEQYRPLLSIEEGQEYLGGISRTKLFNLMRDGEIRRIKIGRSTRIPRASLDAFIERLEVEAEANVEGGS